MAKLIAALLTTGLLMLVSSSAQARDISAGEVEKVDTSKNLLVLSTECECGSGKIIEVTFTLKSETKVSLNGKDAKLADIKKGDRIEIEYEAIDDVQKVAATRDG